MRFWFLAFAAGLQLPGQSQLAVVSAATYVRDGALAPSMIATGFAPAIAGPGLNVSVRDSAGAERAGDVVAAASGQISFIVPAATALGPATVSVTRQGATLAAGNVSIAPIAPGLFTANASGTGVPAGFLLEVGSGGERTMSNLFEPAPGRPLFQPRPFSAAPDGGETYLLLFGTGIRGAAAASITAKIGDAAVPVLAAQAQGEFAGLDQINLGPLPRELGSGRGLAELELSVAGTPANRVTLAPSLPTSGGWGRRADLLEANSEMSVAATGGKIYVFGGYPASRVTVASVQVYDTVANRWSLTSPIPTAVNHSMAAVSNGRIYLIGGQTDANTAYVNLNQEYDPNTATWRGRAPMPTARAGGAAAVIGGKIYVAGGRPPRGADFAVYDPEKDEWTTLPNLPTQRNHLGAVAAGGKLYVIGGRFEGGFQSEQTDRIEIYNPEAGTWTMGAPMLKPRGGLNAVEANGCIHVFGGEFATGVHPDHDVFDPVTNAWTRLNNLPVPVHGVTGAAFLDGLIYLPGGGTMQGGSSGSRIHQVFRPNLVCR